MRSLDFRAQTATMLDRSGGTEIKVNKNQAFGPWTLMAVVQDQQQSLAVFEQVGERTGEIVYVGTQGIVARLPKTAEATSVPDGTKFAGYTLDEIRDAKSDLLTPKLLVGNADPDYDEVKAALPPLRVPTFVGSVYSDEKPTYEYGGYSNEIYVDVGKLYPEIQQARDRKDVYEGLIGGWLPVVRFVFPSGQQRYWEESIFAIQEPGHLWTQPVWYRVLRVDNGKLVEAHYFYHHLPFPPRGEPSASEFYRDLLKLDRYWKQVLHPSMKIDVPDRQLSDLVLRGLSLEMITRVEDDPRYGYPPLGGIDVFGGYGYKNVSTFQDVFTADTMAFLEWGDFYRASRYIDNYFGNYVRDDGSIDTRGPEVGQYGKMLQVLAKYYEYTKDDKLMRKYQNKIEAITDLFFQLRAEAEKVPPTDVTYGIIRGWSEHDSSLQKDPYRFMLPHYASNGEAARGFQELGDAWIEMGAKLKDVQLQAKGRRLLAESEAMKKDMLASIEKSIDRTKNPPYMPAVAGDKPTYGKTRAYMELLESGEMPKDLDKLLIDNLTANGEFLMGLPRGGDHVTAFLDFGSAYSRIRNDWIPDYLLMFYAFRTQLYSPGTWTTVESRRLGGLLGGPYATPSQVTAPIMTKWLLVFEDPSEPVLWLARATPRAWLEHGKKIGVSGAPTRFGVVGYDLQSDIAHGKVTAILHLPVDYAASTKLRIRAPGQKPMKSVTVNGTPWRDFSPQQEVITLPPSFKGTVQLVVSY